MKSIKEQLAERLPSVEAAYTLTGRPRVDFSVYPEDMRVHKEACYNADILVEAARKIERENESGEIDWNDSQRKWIPIFWMSPSAFAFRRSYCGCSCAPAGSGSRLHVKTKEASDYLAETFPEVWEGVQLK